jgi:Family of unknown function (DUF6790)
MFTIVFAALALTGALFHIAFSRTFRRERRSQGRVVETLLVYWFAIAIGAAGLFEFAGHTFRANQVAANIGWPPGSPFQQEVAFADLALGLLGIACIFLRDNFWLATAIAAAVMSWGDALGHTHQIIRYGNHHPGNSGAVLWGNIFIPAIAIVLLILRSRLARSGAGSAAPQTILR